MARNRNTFEKHQRDAKKKRKAEEKRAMRIKKKEEPEIKPETIEENPEGDETIED